MEEHVAETNKPAKQVTSLSIAVAAPQLEPLEPGATTDVDDDHLRHHEKVRDVESDAWLGLDEHGAPLIPCAVVGQYLPSTDLVASFCTVNRASLLLTQQIIRSRLAPVNPTQQEDHDEFRSVKKYRTATVIHLEDAIITSFKDGSILSRVPGPFQPGYLADGTVVGQLADKLVSFGESKERSHRLVRRLEGSFCLAPPKLTKKERRNRQIVVLTPSIYDVTAILSNGTVCRINNCLSVQGNQIWEITLLFAEDRPRSALGQPIRIDSAGAQSFIRGEFSQPTSVKRGYHVNPSISGKGTASSVDFRQILSVDQPSADPGPFDLSLILDGSSAVSGKVMNVSLTTTLQELRLKIKTSLNDILLPERFDFKRYSTTSTGNDAVDTIADILPWNRGQFLQFELPSPFVSSTTCGWPSGICMHHNRVLASVITLLPDQEQDTLEGSMTSQINHSPSAGLHSHSPSVTIDSSPTPFSPTAGLPVSGVHRARAIKEHGRHRNPKNTQQGNPTRMIDIMATAIECARIGAVDSLKSLLEGGTLAAGPAASLMTPMSTKSGGRGRGFNPMASLNQSLASRPHGPVSPSSTTPMGLSLLHIAVDYGQTKVVELLVESGADVLCRTPNGQVPLHLAAQRGHAECFPILLRATDGPAALDVQDKSGKTPLHLALEAGFMNTALWLVEQGANVHVCDVESRSACHVACRKLKTVNEVIAENNTAKLQLMLLSAMESMEGDVEKLLLNPIDIQRELMIVDAPVSLVGAISATQVSAESADPNEVFLETLKSHLTNGKLLLDLDGKQTVSKTNGRVVANVLGLTALLQAVHKHSLDAFLMLIQCAFVDIRARDADGNTALHRISQKGMLPFAQALLALSPLHGVPRQELLRAVNSQGQTPIMCAMAHHRLGPDMNDTSKARSDLIQLLFAQMEKEHLHDVLCLPDDLGLTACHFAVQILAYDAPLAQKCWQLARMVAPDETSVFTTEDASTAPVANKLIAHHFEQRFGSKASSKERQHTEAPTLFAVAVARCSIGALNDLIQYLDAPTSPGFKSILGTIDDRLLLQAFHVGNLQVFQRLLNALNQGIPSLSEISFSKAKVVRWTVQKTGKVNSRGRSDLSFKRTSESLASYILCRCSEQQWIDVLLRDHEVRRSIWEDAKATGGGVVCDLVSELQRRGTLVEIATEIGGKQPASHYPMNMTEYRRPQSRGDTPMTSTANSSATGKRGAHHKQNREALLFDHSKYPAHACMMLLNALEATLSGFSSSAVEEEDRSVLRKLLLRQALRSHGHDKVFAALISFVAGRHFFSNEDVTGLMDLKICRATLHGVQQSLSNKNMDTLNSLHGTGLAGGATPSAGAPSVIGGQSQRGGYAPSNVGGQSINRGMQNALPLSAKRSMSRRSSVGQSKFEHSTKISVSLAGPLSHPYDNRMLSIERNLCQLMPHLVVADPASFLLELVEKRHFASALSFLNGETFTRVSNLYALGNQGKSALHIACENGATNLVTALLSTSCFSLDDPSQENLYPIHYACRNGDLSCVRALLNAGDDPCRSATKYPDETNQRSLGVSPLHFAAQNGNADLVRCLLLHNSVDVEARDVYERTPLHYACINGREQVAVLLIDKGADVERLDREGRNALFHAVCGRHESLVLKLVQWSKKDHLLLCYNPATGRSLAHYAAWYGLGSLLERVIIADRTAVKREEQRRSELASPPAREALRRRRSASGAGALGLQANPIEFNPGVEMLIGLGKAPCLRALIQTSGTASEEPPAERKRQEEVLCSNWLLQSSSVCRTKDTGGLAHWQSALNLQEAPGNHRSDTKAGISTSSPFASFRGASLKVEDGGPLGSLTPLFRASRVQRNTNGDNESLGALNVLRNSVEKVSDGQSQIRMSTISAGKESLLEMADLLSAQPWTPYNYAVANGASKICQIMEKWNIPRVSISIKVEDAGEDHGGLVRSPSSTLKPLKASTTTTSSPVEQDEDAAEGIQFPDVSSTPMDLLTRRSVELENIIFARPPPPPPPVSRWWDGYYGLGGVLGLFKKAAEPTKSKWNFNYDSNHLFDSRVLETLKFWCHHGMAENTEALLPLLSNIDAPIDSAGTTLLMHAAYWNQSEVVKVLLRNGAAKDKTVRLCQEGFNGGITALGLASISCAEETIDVLLAAGADNNIADECGNTPLHHVVARRNFKLTKVLLHSLCSIDLMNHVGELPEDIAVQQRDNEIRRLLRWWGESNNVKSGVARPPCSMAVSLDPWIKAAAIYYQRLDLLHKKYISLSNQDEAHSVPCLLYARVCKLMGYGCTPARSVMNQMKAFWWPEEVRELDLAGIYLGYQGLSTLVHFIKVLPRLELLDLSGNRLTHELLVELLSCIDGHPGLRKISVRNNKDITKLSATKIMDHVKSNTQVVQFDVVDTGMELSQQALIHRLADDNKRRQAMAYQDLSTQAARSPSPTRRDGEKASPKKASQKRKLPEISTTGKHIRNGLSLATTH